MYENPRECNTTITMIQRILNPSLNSSKRVNTEIMVKPKTVCHFIMLITFFSFGKISQTQITFISDRDWNNEIYVMDPNGDNLRRLTNHPAYDGQPSW